jgi:hypothetical protein
MGDDGSACKCVVTATTGLEPWTVSWLSTDIEDNVQIGFQTQNYRQSSLTDQ